MSGSLDMSLDDIIRNKSRSEGHSRDSRRKPRLSGPGPDRRAPTRGPLRTNPYPVRQMQIQVPAFQGQLVSSGGSDMEGKLYVSNLDYGVSNEDIKVLFSEVGDLKRYSINYDKSGRSKGTAEVVFFRQTDALAAIKRYNNVQLDGKPMTIELVGANVLMSSAPVPPTKSGIMRNPNVASKRAWIHSDGGGGGGGGGSNGPNTSGAGRGFARGNRPRGQIGKKLSAEDLDAELDRYHLEATQIK
ncbi:THO complex subunit 4B-like isoform X2 [Durio zibethinus]|uniref:THO complex subunit 4B-like isoform X2 n=1 Tax=Durio zibethinus TaxID=66656 RepID=A0A6P5Z279_DURZI|nr:THO complex subunit 4B-like isoform X2 [Durio zibethinus]